MRNRGILRRLDDREVFMVVVLVGVPHGNPPAIKARDMCVGKICRGTPGGSCRPERDLPMFVHCFREGRLPLDKLVTQRHTLEQINEACDALAHGEVEGRASVKFSESVGARTRSPGSQLLS
jgi:Zn-dependent alcohol dehydrogenase